MYMYTNSGGQYLPGMALARLDLGVRDGWDPDYSIPHPVAGNGGLREGTEEGMGWTLTCFSSGRDQRGGGG